MPHEIDYVDNSGQDAHYNMLERVKDFCDGNGYEILRFDTATADHQLIMKAPGLTGDEEIFMGFRTYQNADADYYNFLAGVFTGYVSSNSFDTQPGARLSGVPAHNNRIDYWLTLNSQRLVLAMKVGTPVYETAYIGKMLPYARPSQYPYPVVCSGMLNGAAALRFSDTSANHSVGFKGNSARMGLRTNDNWVNAYGYPWGNAYIAGTGASTSNTNLRDTDGMYHLMPIELHDNTANIWGALDGVFYISGFNNAVENTVTVDGEDYIIMQDSFRTDAASYFAIRLDENEE